MIHNRPSEIYPVAVWEPTPVHRYYMWLDPGNGPSPKLWLVGGIASEKPRADWIQSPLFESSAVPVPLTIPGSKNGVVIGRALLTGMDWSDFRVRKLESWEQPLVTETLAAGRMAESKVRAESQPRFPIRYIHELGDVPPPQDHYQAARERGIAALDRALATARAAGERVITVQVVVKSERQER